jgi:crossover junction endodeoxyribonuclease RuvC
MRILGIDPGLATIGFAILDYDESQNSSQTVGEKTLQEVGVISTPAGLPIPQRLSEIYKDMQELIREYKPDVCAIEQIFFSKNVSTGIQVSQARGVILLALQEAGVQIHEYNPTAMKAALTGDGRADKAAIQKMVMLELNLSAPPKPDDAADAVSLALTLLCELQYPQ